MYSAIYHARLAGPGKIVCSSDLAKPVISTPMMIRVVLSVSNMTQSRNKKRFLSPGHCKAQPRSNERRRRKMRCVAVTWLQGKTFQSRRWNENIREMRFLGQESLNGSCGMEGLKRGTVPLFVQWGWGGGHTDRVCGGGIVKRGRRQGKVTSDWSLSFSHIWEL